jgi:nucleotide-binding universal stress UspA family protein
MVGFPQSPVATEINTPVYGSHREALFSQHPIYASQIQESQRAEILTELSETVDGLKTLGYDVTVEVTFGDPAEEIINFVTLTDVDLVALTTHGRTGLGKLLFGNVAEALIRQADVPVLLLRPFKR